LLSPRLMHDRLRYFDALFIRVRDRQRERFPWSQGLSPREPPPTTGEVPRGALYLEWSLVVRDTVGANRDRHRGLAEWRIIGGNRRTAQGLDREMMVL